MKKPKFRLRRWLFAKHRQKKVVNFIARQCEKIASYNLNEDRNFQRNGEVWFLTKFAKYCHNNSIKPIVFDVGANIGEWSKALMSEWENINLHCFEPSRTTFEKLTINIPDKLSYNLVNMGLGRKTHKQKFYENDNILMTSKYNRFASSIQNKISVSITTGDEYVRSQNIEQIELIKLDVEGMEFEALLGFKNLLETKNIHMIQFEYGEFNIYSRVLLKDIFDLLTNYKIGKLYPSHIEQVNWSPEIENFKPANFIAIADDQANLLAHFFK